MSATSVLPRAAVRLGSYLYAITDGPAGLDYGAVGIDGGVVTGVGAAGLTAVISPIANTRLRPERRRVAAHHGVLARLHKAHTVLPMAFGVIADGPEAVARILADHRDKLLSALDRVRGRVEMGLRVCWDVPNVFAFFVSHYAELRDFRDRVFAPERTPSPDDKVELGRLFGRVLEEVRAERTRLVLDAIGPCCREWRENRTRTEKDVMNLACLVDASGRPAFEAAVERAAAQFDQHYAFEVTGPWPAHNFVDVRLDL